MVKPIGPNEAIKAKTIPDEVISSFNEMIISRMTGNTATFRQAEVVSLIISKGISKEDISEKNLLDVEDVYQSVGWTVKYDKPAYNENYPATFTFTKK
jgi:hypothetical protein